ncbi:MAG: alpha/beta hydrolase, partial [Alphaproteobacteria bacterium]
PASSGGPLPAVVYFHGGGWTIGCHDTVEPQCRYIANAAQALVVSVEYRLAPEHKFPAAIEDCQAAVRWVHAHAGDIGADPTRLAVAGDSAGGNLAAVTAQQLAKTGGPALAAQALICPITSAVFDTPSYTENEHGPVLTKRMQERWRENYLADPDDDAQRRDPRVSPLLAADEDLKGLPPATVITASHDPLRDEGIAYAERLVAAGVPVRRRNWEGHTHLFPSMGAVVDAAFEALDFAAAGLRQGFDG